MQCEKLKDFVPQGNVKPLPKSLCKKCLNTPNENGKDCPNPKNSKWKASVCKANQSHYRLG